MRRWRKLAGLAGDDVAPYRPIIDALMDDLNFADAMYQMHQLAVAGDVNTLRSSGRFLGLLDDGYDAGDNIRDIRVYR